MSKTDKELLAEYAKTLGVPDFRIRQIVVNVYKEDGALMKLQQEAMQNHANMQQLRLVEVETIYRKTELFLLQRKQQRVMWRIKQWDKVKSLFTKKKKSNEPSK